ncbi:MAG: DUF4350 domain-containing protein [Pseudomonadota bacterium]
MDRLRTLLWVGAVLMLVALLVIPGFNENAEPERPTTDNTSELGLAALHRWLGTARISTHSQRVRFTSSSLAELSTPTGNLAIVHVPAVLLFEADEIAHLMNWIREGNTLLVASGHLESAPWIYDGFDLTRSLWRLTGLPLRPFITWNGDEEISPALNGEASDGDNTSATAGETMGEIRDSLEDALNVPGWLLVHGSAEAVDLASSPGQPFAAGLDGLRVPWDGDQWIPAFPNTSTKAGQGGAQEEEATPDANPLRLIDDDDASAGIEADLAACGGSLYELPTTGLVTRELRGRNGCREILTPGADTWQRLLAHADSEQPVMMQAPLGQGDVLVLLHPSLLANDVLHRFGNRRFAMRLIDTWLGDGGTVIFDDAHQGLNDILESSDLVSDWRLYASIGFVLLFWIGYLLANNGDWARALYRQAPAGMGQLELVRASAGFLDLRLRRDAVYEAILEPLSAQLARKWRLPIQSALKDGLVKERDRHPDLVATIVDRLSAMAAGRRVSYAALQHDIKALSEAIR